VRSLVGDARERGKADTRQAVEAVRKAASEELQKIDRRIDALEKRRSLEPASWGAAAGAALVALALVFGVWLGDRGLTVRYLLTFGFHL
jgi:hypothetical protein